MFLVNNISAWSEIKIILGWNFSIATTPGYE